MIRVEKSNDSWGYWILNKRNKKQPRVENRIWALPTAREGFYNIYEFITPLPSFSYEVNGKRGGYKIFKVGVQKDKVDDLMKQKLESKI